MSERSIKNFIPNLITLTGLCFGLSSIRFAVLEDFKAAVVCILIAAICDVLDGLFSRLLKTQSDLGAELDSLADFLSPPKTNHLLHINQNVIKNTTNRIIRNGSL